MISSSKLVFHVRGKAAAIGSDFECRSIDGQHDHTATRTIRFSKEPLADALVVKDVLTTMERRKGYSIAHLEDFHANTAFRTRQIIVICIVICIIVVAVNIAPATGTGAKGIILLLLLHNF